MSKTQLSRKFQNLQEIDSFTAAWHARRPASIFSGLVGQIYKNIFVLFTAWSFIATVVKCLLQEISVFSGIDLDPEQQCCILYGILLDMRFAGCVQI